MTHNTYLNDTQELQTNPHSHDLHSLLLEMVALVTHVERVFG